MKPTKSQVFAYWSEREKEEPDFWKERGEYNITEMIDMAMDNFDDYLFEEYFEDLAWEYGNNSK